MNRGAYIALAVALALAGAAVSCSGPKVIPPSKLSKIYRDMYVADQWLSDYRMFREAADSTLFYESIFEKYGYSTEDFNRSVEYYLDDPERFGRILNKAQAMLENDIKEIDREKSRSESEADKKIVPAPGMEAAPVDTLAEIKAKSKKKK